MKGPSFLTNVHTWLGNMWVLHLGISQFESLGIRGYRIIGFRV